MTSDFLAKVKWLDVILTERPERLYSRFLFILYSLKIGPFMCLNWAVPSHSLVSLLFFR